MPCNSSGELAINVRSPAYIGAPQKMPSMYAPRPDAASISRSWSTNMQYRKGDSTPPCLTPCLMQKGWDFWPSQMTELVAELYQLLIRCHRCPLTPFWWSFTKRPSCQTVLKALRTSRKATLPLFPLSHRDCTASCSTKVEHYFGPRNQQNRTEVLFHYSMLMYSGDCLP